MTKAPAIRSEKSHGAEPPSMRGGESFASAVNALSMACSDLQAGFGDVAVVVLDIAPPILAGVRIEMTSAFRPLDVTNSECECAWDSALKPIGEFWNREAFDLWRDRCQVQVGHLHRMIAEQWIYKHWGESPYRHLPLEQLRWCLE